TYMAVRSSSTAISGFYSIRMGEVVYDRLPADRRKGLPKYSLPVVHLARLAVDERERGKGLGELLLLDAFERAVRLAAVIGATATWVLPRRRSRMRSLPRSRGGPPRARRTSRAGG